MSNRSSNSSSRATGGLNASGNPLDTVIVIGGGGSKNVLGISWAFSTLGSAFPITDILTSRIVVVGGVDLGQALSGNITLGFPDALGSYAGRIMFDTQVLGGAYTDFTTRVMAIPISGQFLFPAESNEGKLSVDSGPISIIMTAPYKVFSPGAPTNVQGVLTVQYDMNYDTVPARGYGYPIYSGPVSR